MMKDLKTFEKTFLLKNNYIGYLSYTWKGNPFVVPITYYYDEKENCLLSYSGEGHKIRAMRQNSSVSFTIAEIKSVNNWQSIMVHGHFEELGGAYAKQELRKFALGVKTIILKKENLNPDLISDFSSKVTTGEPVIYRIAISEITGKFREF